MRLALLADRSLNRLVTLAVVLVVVLGVFARSARASVVLVKPGGDVHVSDVRLAHASSAARTVTWEQLVLDEARGDLAWVIPVPRGGWLETGDDHWFEALDEATAAVIAPHKSLECAAFARESTAGYRAVTAPRVISAGFSPLAPAAAIDKLTALGFVVDASSRAAILALDGLGEDVAILTLPSGARGLTKVVRVLGPSGRVVPMMLMPSGGALPRLTTYTFAEARAKFAGLPAAEVDASKLAWSGGASNYRELLDDTIVAAAPGVALTFAGTDGVFTDQPGGAAGVTVTSLTRRYFGAADGCVARAAALSSSAKPVAPTCAKPSPFLAGATPPSCAVATSEQLAASELTCGALDDLAAASGGVAPARVVLTRLDGVAATLPKGAALELSPLGSVLSFREAKLGPLCGSTNPGTSPPTGSDPPSGPTTPSQDPSGSGSSHSSSSSGDGCSSTAQVFADSCTSSSSGSGGGCGGDSSSDSSCSGDSSSDSSCSGDSSDSGGCSGASDSADDGCSSSSSSSSGCSGASSSADDGCRAARVRPRIRFSAGVYAMIALLAIARRFGRRPRYHGDGERCRETTSTDARAHE